MASKTSKLLPKLLVGCAGVFIIVHNLHAVLIALLLLVTIPGAGLIAFTVFVKHRRKSARERLMLKVNGIVGEKLVQLARRRAQLVRPDAYGKPQMDKWIKEIDYFIDNHILSALTSRDQQLLQSERGNVVRLITQRTYEQTQTEPASMVFSEGLTAYDFELFCAEQLKLAGWQADATRRSQDQGVDVVAEKSGTRVVLQCKLYSGPVGNGAVQEIAAGRAHERAHYGVVVSNSRYTSSAEQLAMTNGILLLHYRDLANLEGLLTRQAA